MIVALFKALFKVGGGGEGGGVTFGGIGVHNFPMEIV